MTPREFLDLLASNLSARMPRGRTHLAAFAPLLPKDVPRHWLTVEMAEAVEPHLLALPTYAELLAAMRREGVRFPEPAQRQGSAQPATGEDGWTERWYQHACQSLIENGPQRLEHLLSLLWTYSRPAWERFAAEHAPDVLADYRDRNREIAQRRARGTELSVPTPRACGIPFMQRSRPAPPTPDAMCRASLKPGSVYC